MKLVVFDHVTVKFHSREVLKDISFSINQGDYIALVGPNGAGKTTLIKTLLGLIKPQQGMVQNFSRHTGYLQQKIALADSRFPANVTEIVLSGLLMKKKFPKRYNKNDKAEVKKTLDILQIPHLQSKNIGKLSGGELQKVLLARALVCQPDLLVLDEPTTALDQASRKNFYNLMQQLQQQQNITLLAISHDLEGIRDYANKVFYVDQTLQIQDSSGFLLQTS